MLSPFIKGFFASHLLFVAVISVFSSACGRMISPKNQAKSVEIPLTSIKNQENSGFCVSYAVSGFLESEYKIKTGKEIDLSDEYLGFYVMLEQMIYEMEQTQKLPLPEQALRYEKLKKELADDKNYSRFQGSYVIGPGDQNSFSLFTILKKYGVVPQKSFTRKFSDERMAKAAGFEIHKKFLELWNEPSKIVSREQLVGSVLTGGLGFLKPPPRLIHIDGQTLTPQQYFASLNVNIDDFAGIDAQSSADFDWMMQATKETLARGHSVPLAASVDFYNWQNETRDGGIWLDRFAGPSWQNLSTSFGHQVLVVDFVNRGGRPGSMNPEQLNFELQKHPRLLDYLVVKNSWGQTTGNVDGNEPGFYSLSRDFLLANTFQQSLVLQVVVLKEVADRLRPKKHVGL
jgi:hypothetical protein